MYRKILFAVEDDEALPSAIWAVTAFARSSLAQVHVIHVTCGDPASPTSSSRRLVEVVIGCLRSQGVLTDGEVLPVRRDNEVAPLIAATAARVEADLVVMGSRGRSDLAGLVLGSVSHRVAASVDIPILIIRAGACAAEPRKILVALDGSEAGDEAVAEAAELAAQFRAEVMVLHVQQLVAVQGAALVEPEDEAWAVVDRAAARLKGEGVNARGEVYVGHNVAAAIVSAAERSGADVVVLGSRRPSEVGRLLLGSVGRQVVHRLGRPVLLARRVHVLEAVG